MGKLAVISVFLLSSVSTQFVKIDESVRFSEGTEGIALSVSNYAVDYLKTAYLPYIYEKVQTFNLPEFDFHHGLIKGSINTTVSIPEPEQQFITNWETKFISSENALQISNSRQDIIIDSAVDIKIGGMTVSSGQIIANLQDLNFKFDVEFTTQDAKFVEATGTAQGSEQSPAIDIENLQIDIATAKSDIKLKGFFLSGLGDLILELFNREIFNDIIRKSEKYIENTLVEKINKELYDYGSHIEIGDGVGFDYSLTKKPSVTDDEMLTIFMNGTFYSADAQAGILGEQIVTTEHPVFEIGAQGQQDLMLHVSQSVFDSGINTIVQKQSGFNVSDFWQTTFGEPLTLGSKIMERVCKKVHESGDNDTHVDLLMHLSDMNNFAINEDNVNFNQSARFVIKDKQGTLMTDFELDDINFDLNITSIANLTQINSNWNNFKFMDQKINEQGSVYLDIREVMRDNSGAFSDLSDDIDSYFNFRKKYYNSLIFFEEKEIKLADSLVFAGVTFDFVYLGRPQDWNTAD